MIRKSVGKKYLLEIKKVNMIIVRYSCKTVLCQTNVQYVPKL